MYKLGTIVVRRYSKVKDAKKNIFKVVKVEDIANTYGGTGTYISIMNPKGKISKTQHWKLTTPHRLLLTLEGSASFHRNKALVYKDQANRLNEVLNQENELFPQV